MTERIAVGALALLFVTAALVLSAWEAPEPLPSAVSPLSFQSARSANPVADGAPLSPAAAAEMLNLAPPPIEVLRDNPQLQAAYDSQATAGEFVTPPAVSVPH